MMRRSTDPFTEIPGVRERDGADHDASVVISLF